MTPDNTLLIADRIASIVLMVTGVILAAIGFFQAIYLLEALPSVVSIMMGSLFMYVGITREVNKGNKGGDDK